MAELQLSYEGLKTQAKAIERKKTELEGLITDVMKTVKHLDSVWKDKAASDFIHKVEQMKPTFDSFSQALDGLQKHMNNVAMKYEQLSSDIISAQKF